jgi:creatinine amidohydrolase
MQWEQLTSADFENAARETGVCVMAMGVIEKHGEHLPLGTDMLNSYRLACLAAEKEPAVVYPPWYFGQIYEARCFPGTITIKPTLLLELIEGVLDEIGRNGFRKILLLNGHGGNDHLLAFLAQCTLWKPKPYSLYVTRISEASPLTPEEVKRRTSLLETPYHAHACECETSVSLANHPHLVRLDRIPAAGGEPLKRLAHFTSAFEGIRWYANHPEHYAGDARPASVQKGLQIRQLLVDALARLIAQVKADAVVPRLEEEFFARVEAVKGAKGAARPRARPGAVSAAKRGVKHGKTG